MHFPEPVPGMDADVVNENGQPVREQVGELIIRKPLDRNDPWFLAG